jgi:hypothetical protein
VLFLQKAFFPRLKGESYEKNWKEFVVTYVCLCRDKDQRSNKQKNSTTLICSKFCMNQSVHDAKAANQEFSTPSYRPIMFWEAENSANQRFSSLRWQSSKALRGGYVVTPAWRRWEFNKSDVLFPSLAGIDFWVGFGGIETRGVRWYL